MSLRTSTHFASAHTTGTDWRECSKTILEQFEGIRTQNDNFNIGFVYISDHLVEDAASIFNLFRSVTGIENWVGCNGIAICGHDNVMSDGPTISAMIGALPDDSFSLFTTADESSEDTQHDFKSWQSRHMPLLTIVHASPLQESDPDSMLTDLSAELGSFMIGGFSSSHQGHIHLANAIMEDGASGVCFSEGVAVSTALTQGCQPIGELHMITKCEENNIYEIDGRPPFDVFEDDLRKLVQGKSSNVVNFDELDDDDLAEDEDMPEAFQDILKGDVHVAFMVPGSDKQDYTVRNIIGMDLEQNLLMVSHEPHIGEHMLFVHRDQDTVKRDLTTTLIDLRKRVTKERGSFEPKAGLYISCVARHNDQTSEAEDEITLIREIIGDIPLTGFYASGEISNQRLYAYTGIITLFF